jgi:hypothetical protein
VLDLGLGGGIDVLLSARPVGSISNPHGFCNIEEARAFLRPGGLDVDALAKDVGGEFVSSFVRVIKPATICF